MNNMFTINSCFSASGVAPLNIIEMFQIMALVAGEDGPKYLYEGIHHRRNYQGQYCYSRFSYYGLFWL